VTGECRTCAKHRGEGPLGGQLVTQLDGFWIYHAPPGPDGQAPLGYLFIESDRHVPHLGALSEEEAMALGRLRTRLAAALRAEVAAEHVFAAVIGQTEPHFHEHLVTRHPDTPPDIPWHRSDEFLPRANADEVEDLARRLAGHLERA
jgi:diadenosine tetraphosphate (Ap4A) HIT family hydrolase